MQACARRPHSTLNVLCVSSWSCHCHRRVGDGFATGSISHPLKTPTEIVNLEATESAPEPYAYHAIRLCGAEPLLMFQVRVSHVITGMSCKHSMCRFHFLGLLRRYQVRSVDIAFIMSSTVKLISIKCKDSDCKRRPAVFRRGMLVNCKKVVTLPVSPLPRLTNSSSASPVTCQLVPYSIVSHQLPSPNARGGS